MDRDSIKLGCLNSSGVVCRAYLHLKLLKAGELCNSHLLNYLNFNPTGSSKISRDEYKSDFFFFFLNLLVHIKELKSLIFVHYPCLRDEKV